MKKIIIFILRISISFGLLGFLFTKIDLKEVLRTLSLFKPAFLIFSFLLFLSSSLLGFFRWRMLLKITSTNFSNYRMFISFWGSQFFNLFLPSLIGSDIMRSVDLGLHVKNVKRVVATVFLDRLSGYIGLLLVALVALLFGYKFIKEVAVYIIVFTLSIVLLITLFFIFHQAPFLKITRFLKERGKMQDILRILYEEIYYFRNHPKSLIRNILISLVIQASIPLMYYILILGLDIRINPILIFVLVPILSVIALIPISIGGLGVREVGAVYLFTKIGIAKNIAVSLSLVNFFLILLISLIGGIIYVLTVHTRRI